MIETVLDKLETSIEGIKKKYYGVSVGIVTDLVDPMTLGRVQVRLPWIDSNDLSAWARVATPLAGSLMGFYFIPQIGDEVLVAFEQGDVGVPYIIGSLWNATAPPPLPSPLPQISMIKTISENTIMFTEVPPSITIKTPSGQTVLLDSAGIQIISDTDNTITLTSAGIQIMAGANIVSLTPDGIDLTGSTVTITADTAVSITASTITLTGGMVNIN